jgi:hypothetical protein
LSNISKSHEVKKRKREQKGGTLNFERAPLKLQRKVIKSKEKRARERERRERGGSGGGQVSLGSL